MIAATTIWLFLLAILALFLSPGPNMAFVISHGIAHGRWGGCAAAFGIAAADLVLTVLTVSGVTAMIAAWEPSYDLLRHVGAVYLLWLAVHVIRRGSIDLSSDVDQQTVGRVVGRAMLNSLLNPKALLFFMVFLPQFADVTRGRVGLQLAILGGMLATAGLVFNLLLGSFAGQLGALMRRHPKMARVQQYGLAGVFAALAARLFLMDRPALR